MSARTASTTIILQSALLLWTCCALAEDAPELNARVTGLVAATKLQKAAVGVSIIDVQTGRTLCAINDRSLMIPASNTKLVTTAAALLLLGGEHQFTTKIYAAGEVRDGVLDGHLVVTADGDPAISGREYGGQTTAVLDAWAAAASKNIRTVRGSIIIDDTVFDREYIHPSWPVDQLVHWYCAPVSAFAFNDNCVDVSVKPAEAADRLARVTLDPPTDYAEVRNSCTTVASGKVKAYISRLPNADTILVTGKLTTQSPGASASVPVTNPALYAGTVLKERLAAAGVKVEGRILLAEKRVDTSQMELIASTSHSLAGAVRTANKRSQNFYSEMILKTLGRSVSVPSSFAAGVKCVAGFLDGIGIREGTYVMDDGSGLSRRNAVSAWQFAAVLRHVALSSQAETFIDSLSVAGVDGSLARRMVEPACAGKVFGKTGHLRGVSALSGYARSGERLIAFSILVNGEGLNLSAADNLQDAICRLLVDLKQ